MFVNLQTFLESRRNREHNLYFNSDLLLVLQFFVYAPLLHRSKSFLISREWRGECCLVLLVILVSYIIIGFINNVLFLDNRYVLVSSYVVDQWFGCVNADYRQTFESYSRSRSRTCYR